MKSREVRSCIGYLTIKLFLEPEWALSLAHEAEGLIAFDSEAMRARGIIVLVKFN